MSDTNRREAQRHRSLLQGRIYFNDRRSSADCTIRDITESGARLLFADPIAVPGVIELHIPHRRECYRAEVRWQRGREIGVQIDNAEISSVESPSVVPAAGATVEERLRRLEYEMATMRRRLDDVLKQGY